MDGVERTLNDRTMDVREASERARKLGIGMSGEQL